MPRPFHSEARKTRLFYVRQKVIEFTELQGPHCGKNLAAIVEACPLELDLVPKLLSITEDNASNNEAMISDFYYRLSRQFEEQGKPETDLRFQGLSGVWPMSLTLSSRIYLVSWGQGIGRRQIRLVIVWEMGVPALLNRLWINFVFSLSRSRGLPRENNSGRIFVISTTCATSLSNTTLICGGTPHTGWLWMA
jgi:hypothetical protein